MWYLFTPELYFLFAGLVFLLMAMMKETDPKRDYYIALMVSSLGVVVALGSLKLEGSLFFGAYRVDLFSQVFKALLAMGFFLVVTICDDLDGIREGSHPEFYLFMTTCTVGMMMLVSAVELITIYVALELSSYSLYILVPLRKGDQVDLEAAIKYLMIGATSSALLLFGMSYIYGLTHTTYLVQIFHILPQLMGKPAAAVGFVLLLTGFFFKLAIFPFHFWAPDVYYGSANQVTTYIATASKVGAIAILIRMVSLATGADSAYLLDILVTLSIVSMTLGNLVAIIQKDLKRMLAYSSIAHAGYVLIGILSMSREGYASAMFYALAYLIMNFSCFMVLTKVAEGGKNLKIKELAGLHKRSPLLALTLMLGLFGLAGIPPTVGFTGKFLLFTAAMEQGYFALVVIGMINATISLYYYLIVVKAAYLLEPEYELPGVDLNYGYRILSYFLIVAMVVAGIFPARFFGMALEAAKLLII